MDTLIWAALLVVGGYLAVFLVDRVWGKTLFRADFSEREKVLRERLDQMSVTIQVLSNQLNEKSNAESNQRVKTIEQDKLIVTLQKELESVRAALTSAQKEITDLKRQLEEKNVIDKSTDIVVLGIWPDNPEGLPKLDQAGEADAIYDAGFTYVSLLGRTATPDGIVWEMDRVLPNVLEIGAHDDDRGRVLLANGPIDNGWWSDLLEGREIELAMLLFCRSSLQDRMNLSDVMLRAGVKSVVSFDRPVEDAQAVHFAKMIYAKLAEGMTIQQAVQRAKLVVNRQTRDMVRLRTNK